MTTNQTIGLLIAVVVIVAGALYLLKPHGAAMAPTTPTETMQPSTTEMSTTTTTSSSAPVTISYNGSTFSPASVSIAAGTQVTWVNNSTKPVWVASDPHPVHTGYDGTSKDQHCAAGYTGAAPFDACKAVAPGASFTFVFTKAGTWGYHDHLNHDATGSVTVATAAATTTTTVKVQVQ
jgi:plastocyanin